MGESAVTGRALPGHMPAVRTPGEEFDAQFSRAFSAEHGRLFGYVQRLCGDPDLASDVAQEALVRLYRRGALPDSAAAWLVTVATNLLRNAAAKAARRRRLLFRVADRDAVQLPADGVVVDEERARVREALARLAPRDQRLLAMLAGGYRYREMAAALGLNDASVGTLLARAKRDFRRHYGAPDDAS